MKRTIRIKKRPDGRPYAEGLTEWETAFEEQHRTVELNTPAGVLSWTDRWEMPGGPEMAEDLERRLVEHQEQHPELYPELNLVGENNVI